MVIPDLSEEVYRKLCSCCVVFRHKAPLPVVWFRKAHEVQVMGFDGAGEDFAAFGDDYFIGVRTEFGDENAASHRKAEAAALADGVADKAVMAAQDFAVFRDEIAGF